MTNRFTIALGDEDSAIPAVDARLGFRAGYVIEVVDDEWDEVLEAQVFALNPKQYNLSEPFALTLTPGDDDMVVSEEAGIIIREITIDGTFGLSKKTAPTFTTNTRANTGASSTAKGGGTKSGNQHFLALRKMFRDYGKLKKDPTRGPNIRMIFHSLKDDDHFVVVPRQFETPRDSRTSRFTYEYRITMAAIAESDRRVVPQGDDFGNPLKIVMEALNDARAFFSELTSELSLLKRQAGNIQAVLINANALITSVSNLVTGATDFIDFGFKQAVGVVNSVADVADTIANTLLDVTVGTIGDAVRNLQRMEAAFNRILAFPDKFTGAGNDLSRLFREYEGERGLTQADIENSTAGASLGSSTRIARGSSGSAGLSLDDFDGFRRHTVTGTDTLSGIAGRYDVPPELIIVINDLRFPYIADGAGPGVRSAGDELLIPTRGGSSTGGSRRGHASVEDTLYGRDIALDERVFLRERKLEWKVATTHGAMDAETVSGVANVVQGIQLIVRQERGSNAYLQSVGIRRTPGQKGTIERVMMTALNLREGVLLDSRVIDIDSIDVVLDGDVLTQEITPILRGQRNDLTLVVPFGRATGD